MGAGSSRSARRTTPRRGFEFIFPTRPAPKGSREGADRLGDVGAHRRGATLDVDEDEEDDEDEPVQAPLFPELDEDDDDAGGHGRRARQPPIARRLAAAGDGPARRQGAAPRHGTADNAQRAALIEETLASFGVDARVVQINEGPTVTQFGIEPGWEIKTRTVVERDKDNKPILDKDGKPKTRTEEVSRTRVRVKQITSLANDLALALAAPSLRIEAPVPGKPVLGIEVPNTPQVARDAAQRRRDAGVPAAGGEDASWRCALGQSVSGEPVVADLAKMPHLLIAGATGSGKCVCMNSIIACILMHASPEEVRFVMIDPKRVELSASRRSRTSRSRTSSSTWTRSSARCRRVIHEMEARYRSSPPSPCATSRLQQAARASTEKLPYWVVIIDELADLMMAAPFEVERQICRLAQLARATGIHLVVATQRPSVDVITGLIKANFPTRIAFAVSSQVDSRTILDMAGAEKLLGRGDMLYMATDAAKPKRLQGVYVSDEEIERLVDFWTQERFADIERPTFDHLLEEAKAELEQEGATDDMFEQAKELAVRAQPHLAPRCCSAACASATRARRASWTGSKKKASSAPPRAAARARSTPPKTAPCSPNP